MVENRDNAWEIDAIAGIMTVVFFLLYMLVISPVLSHVFFNTNMVIDPALSWEFGRSTISNEDIEKFLYIVFTISLPFITIPLLLFFRSKLLNEIDHRFAQIGSRVLIGLALVSISGMIVYWNRPFLIYSIYNNHAMYFIVMTLLLAYIAYREFQLPRSQMACRIYGYAAGLILLIFTIVIASNSTAAISDQRLQLHFMSYFRSVVQSYFGKTIFVGTDSSYGAYSLVLLPLFKIIGLRLFTFSFVMIVLTCISFGCLFLFLYSITSSYCLSIMSLGSMLWYGYVWNNSVLYFDRFFQTVPHRILFPAIMVWLVWRYQKQRNAYVKKFQYHVICAFCIFGMIWNPETGAIVLLSWFIFLFLDTVTAYGSAGIFRVIRVIFYHLVRQVIWLAVIFLLFSAIIYFRTGEVINLAYKLFYFPILIGMYGIDAIPVNTDSWQFTALVYIIGFLYGMARLLFDGHADKKQALMLVFLSILGTGLFNYFTGHSEVFTLASVSWPCFLILAVICKDLILGLHAMAHREASPYMAYKKFLMQYSMVLICFIIGSGLLNITHWDTFRKQREINEKLNSKYGINYSKIENRMRNLPGLLRRVESGTEILIISNAAPIYHLYSQTTSPVDVFSKREVNDYVTRGGWSQIIIDANEFPFNWDDSFISDIYGEIRRKSSSVIERSKLQFYFK